MPISKIESKISSTLSSLLDYVSYEELQGCLDVLRSSYITSLSNRDSIDRDDIDFFLSINPCTIETCDNIQLAISSMIDAARFNSNGACRLKRIFVDKAVFDINFDFDPKVDVYFYGCKIIRNIHPLDGHIVGICESKFKLVEPKFLFSIGKIK